MANTNAAHFGGEAGNSARAKCGADVTKIEAQEPGGQFLVEMFLIRAIRDFLREVLEPGNDGARCRCIGDGAESIFFEEHGANFHTSEFAVRIESRDDYEAFAFQWGGDIARGETAQTVETERRSAAGCLNALVTADSMAVGSGQQIESRLRQHVHQLDVLGGGPIGAEAAGVEQRDAESSAEAFHFVQRLQAAQRCRGFYACKIACGEIGGGLRCSPEPHAKPAQPVPDENLGRILRIAACSDGDHLGARNRLARHNDARAAEIVTMIVRDADGVRADGRKIFERIGGS